MIKSSTIKEWYYFARCRGLRGGVPNHNPNWKNRFFYFRIPSDEPLHVCWNIKVSSDHLNKWLAVLRISRLDIKTILSPEFLGGIWNLCILIPCHILLLPRPHQSCHWMTNVGLLFLLLGWIWVSFYSYYFFCSFLHVILTICV